MMEKDSKIYIAGHTGLVGSGLLRRLKKDGFTNIITKTHAGLDLLRQADVEGFFMAERPEYVFLAAARVGGIHANSAYPAQFIYDNLAIGLNIIHSAYLYGAKKLLFFGSSCAYPRLSSQPMKEEYLLSGLLEPTNEAYAVAKIAGMKMCQSYSRQYGRDFICAIPATVYGPGDNFDPMNSHVIPALIRKFHEAKEAGQSSVTVWGTGSPQREFLHVDDLADACLFLMENYDSPEIINIGYGRDYPVSELAHMIKDVIGYNGAVVFDASRPDGFPRKMLDPSKLHALGWQARIPLEKGLKETYEWFLRQQGAKKA